MYCANIQETGRKIITRPVSGDFCKNDLFVGSLLIGIISIFFKFSNHK